MKQFTVPSGSLSVPDDWKDASTYVLAAPRRGGFTPTLVITQSPQKTLCSLEEHMRQIYPELEKISGFRLLRRTNPVKHPAGTSLVLDFTVKSDQHVLPLFQRQMYVLTSHTLYCLTATLPLERCIDLIPTLEQAFDSFCPCDWQVGQ